MLCFLLKDPQLSGQHTQIWKDILLKLNTSTGDYFENLNLHQKQLHIQPQFTDIYRSVLPENQGTYQRLSPLRELEIDYYPETTLATDLQRKRQMIARPSFPSKIGTGGPTPKRTVSLTLVWYWRHILISNRKDVLVIKNRSKLPC